MRKRLEQLLLRKPTSVLGIDIGSTSVKIVEIAWNKGRALLKNLNIADIKPGIVSEGKIVDVAGMTEILSSAVANSGTTCRDVVTAVNGQAIFIRELPFPAMEEAEMREAIKWDMEKYVPYSQDSYYYDFATVGPGNNLQEVRVLVVAAPHDAVDPLVATVKGSGLRPLAIDIEPLALFRTLKKEENTLIIDIGANITQIILYQNGCPVVTRILPIAGNRFTETIRSALDLEWNEAENLKLRQRNLLQRLDSNSEFTTLHTQLNLIVKELARDVRRTVEYYQMQNRDAIIENFYLTGGGANIDNLAPNLAALLDDVPVLEHNPLDFIDVSSSFDLTYIKMLAPRLSVAIGLGLRGGGV
ncbi:MAG: type IV pilus assembly protein PilM [Veillonellaceae bacterium]|nr:type IV pilus assembly protein PilM [Veillonellaceae bacterium]